MDESTQQAGGPMVKIILEVFATSTHKEDGDLTNLVDAVIRHFREQRHLPHVGGLASVSEVHGSMQGNADAVSYFLRVATLAKELQRQLTEVGLLDPETKVDLFDDGENVERVNLADGVRAACARAIVELEFVIHTMVAKALENLYAELQEAEAVAEAVAIKEI